MFMYMYQHDGSFFVVDLFGYLASGREEIALQRGQTQRRDAGHDLGTGREIAPVLETDADHDQEIEDGARGPGTDADHGLETGEIVQALERGVEVGLETRGAGEAHQKTEVVEVGGGLGTGGKGRDQETEEVNQGHAPGRGGTDKLVLTKIHAL